MLFNDNKMNVSNIVTDSSEDDDEVLFQNFKKYSKTPLNCRKDIKHIINSIISNDNIEEVNDLKSKMEYLNDVEQPEQRTKEWFDYRHNRVTASAVSNILGTKSDYKNYLKDKVIPSLNYNIFNSIKACKHGIQFEIIAQKIYEELTNTKVGEYGCIPHKTITHLGASPDGIVIESKDPKLAGRMLEIKCLYSRMLTGIPLYKYWVQCQVQLEVCDLDYCDFFECKIDETVSKTVFYKKICNKKQFYGILIEYTKRSDYPRIHNEYSAITNTKEYYEIWSDYKLDALINDNDVLSITIKYWYLKKYSLKTIHRDKDWFQCIKNSIKNFWNKVLKTKELIKKFPEKQNELFPEKEKKPYEKYPTEYAFIDN